VLLFYPGNESSGKNSEVEAPRSKAQKDRDRRDLNKWIVKFGKERRSLDDKGSRRMNETNLTQKRTGQCRTRAKADRSSLVAEMAYAGEQHR